MDKKGILLILMASEFFLSEDLEAKAKAAREMLAVEYGIIDLYGEAEKEGLTIGFDPREIK